MKNPSVNKAEANFWDENFDNYDFLFAEENSKWEIARDVLHWIDLFDRHILNREKFPAGEVFQNCFYVMDGFPSIKIYVEREFTTYEFVNVNSKYHLLTVTHKDTNQVSFYLYIVSEKMVIDLM